MKDQFPQIVQSEKTYIYMDKYKNFCPELISDDYLKSTEQIMNAFVLNNVNNITIAVKAVILAKNIYSSFKDRANPINLIEMMCIVQNLAHGVSIRPYEFAANCNRSFLTNKTFANSIQKQEFINLQFLTDYKINFDGENIKYLPTYHKLIEDLMYKRDDNNCHETSDSLIYEIIQPKCEDLRFDSLNIISEELNKFTSNFEKSIKNKCPLSEDQLWILNNNVEPSINKKEI